MYHKLSTALCYPATFHIHMKYHEDDDNSNAMKYMPCTASLPFDMSGYAFGFVALTNRPWSLLSSNDSHFALVLQSKVPDSSIPPYLYVSVHISYIYFSGFDLTDRPYNLS